MTAAASSRFAPGAIIAGRYRLVALLGRGGMGEVYRADDLTLDQPVALKFLPEGVGDPQKLAQFHNELRTARLVSHKNVVRLYDLGEAQGRRFLTMEYIDGEDLASLLRTHRRIPQDKAIELARQLCAASPPRTSAVCCIATLKPANVMIDGDGNVRITDFGIARHCRDAARPATNVATFAGTPQYMAPEHWPASRITRSDIYAWADPVRDLHGPSARSMRSRWPISNTGMTRRHDDAGDAGARSRSRQSSASSCAASKRTRSTVPDRRSPLPRRFPGGDPLASQRSPPARRRRRNCWSPPVETEALGVGTGPAGVAASSSLRWRSSSRLHRAERLWFGAARKNRQRSSADRARQILNSFGYTDSVADTAYDMTISQTFLRWAAANDQARQSMGRAEDRKSARARLLASHEPAGRWRRSGRQRT
jgi:serine/threonine protein kinase